MPAKKKAKKKATKKKATKKKATKKKATKKKATKKKATKKKATKKKATKKKATKKKATKKKATKKKATKKKTTKKKAKKKAKRKPNPAFMAPWNVSPALAAVVGSRPLPRTEITKKLWAYIKKNKLQDKVKRTMINADATLQRVFGGKKKVSMFEMTKLISKHLSK